jgi:hypothetical protein
MMHYLIIAFFAVLIGLTLLAARMWHTRRRPDMPADERRLFGRFLVGLAILWVVTVAAYFGGPYLSAAMH